MITITAFKKEDIPQMIKIWNEVVEDGMAFPQKTPLTEQTAKTFFEEQTFCGVAKDESGAIVGLYILHPNNIGRAGHICNASYAVDSSRRGEHIGEKLVKHCIEKAKECGFRILQFNAVVDSNTAALHLYTRLGFCDLGIIPGGFLNKNGVYEDIHIMYYNLV